MNIKLLDVVGPIMIGPSSSHTAGAARLAKVALLIANRPFDSVEFGLGGSFASTYKGHFTDCALLAGVMGFSEDDERLADSFDLASKSNLKYEFYPMDIESEYENTARVTFKYEDGSSFFVEGASLGGGRILITNINGLVCEMNAVSPTIIIKQKDSAGVIGAVATALAQENINIGVMTVSRLARGHIGFCVLECDDFIDETVVEKLTEIKNVISVVAVNI